MSSLTPLPVTYLLLEIRGDNYPDTGGTKQNACSQNPINKHIFTFYSKNGEINMPELSRFLGIVIYMYFNEHNPPHFHAEYNEFKASISIKNLGLIEGKLPPKVMSLVVEWAQEHQEELLRNWNSIQDEGKYHKIRPLV